MTSYLVYALLNPEKF
ncbi:K(+)-transporting ATPase subunit F [Bacillus thuringiensis]|uniref:K(+)-transporting ATPase subunit F n=1 Tax=Bacillus thuringiensis TaxID=1428 RepID=A0AAW9JE77_BACTU|nr:K(+)-transporting ATPase subunit F [Bacillus thuringiensis]MDZ5480341.1 K(+)-transporting ATPase subunit F [Bacillus thuringiensis]